MVRCVELVYKTLEKSMQVWCEGHVRTLCAERVGQGALEMPGQAEVDTFVPIN